MAGIKEVSPGNGATAGKKIVLPPQETLTLVTRGAVATAVGSKIDVYSKKNIYFRLLRGQNKWGNS